MSLLPVLLNELIEDLNNFNRPLPTPLIDIYDQHFGLGLGDIPPSRISPNMPARRAGYVRLWRQFSPPESGISTVKSNNHEFIVRLDVSHFKPEELNVHVDATDHVVVEGKHDERVDEHGLISRHFTRRYEVPESVDLETIASSLSTDGVLTLTAAKKGKIETPNRTIKIVQTNQPATESHTPTVDPATIIQTDEQHTSDESSAEA